MENVQGLRPPLYPGIDAGKIIAPQAELNQFYPKKVDFDDIANAKQQKQQQTLTGPRARNHRESKQITFIYALRNYGTNSQQARQVFSSEMLRLPALFSFLLTFTGMFPVLLLVTDIPALNVSLAVIYAIISYLLCFLFVTRELFLLDCYRLYKINILVGEVWNLVCLACFVSVLVLTFICLWNYSHELYIFSAASKRLLVAAGFLMWVMPCRSILDTIERRMMVHSSGHVYYENVIGGGQIYKVDEYVLSCKYIRDEFDEFQYFVIEAPEPVRDQYMLIGEQNTL